MDIIADKVIGGLSTLALEEFGIISNLKGDKQRIESLVSAIKAVLKDAEAKANNHQVSIWLEELKDVLLDADDLLDDFSTEALRSKLMTGNKMMNKVKIFFSKHNQIAYASKMGHRMKEIRERLDVIANNRHQLQLTDQPVEAPIAYRHRQTYSYVAEDEIIGREEERDLVKDYLFDADVTEDHVSLISIVGIGGLGKTALAQLVYNDKDVQEYFDLTKWVCVSDEFDICKIAQNIIEQSQDSVVEQVQQKLREKIRGKKYLLVLDDVWSEDGEQWHKLKGLLMEGGKGSKIIVTSRSHTVAKIMSPNPPLVLKGLDPERSWKLFCRVALDDREEVHNQELVAIGKDIVRKCAGVPLAIRSVGSLLFARNLGQGDWKYFRDVEFSRIDQQQDKIFPILKLSYDHLPSYLKSCFAYCSLFPKDYHFDRAQLINLWIAEGLIQPSNDIRCEEDVGHEYFMQLLSRSFFQDVIMDISGEIGWCKMHDLIHDLAQLVSGDEHIVLIEGKETNISKRTRHLSNHFSRVLNCNFSSLLKRDKIRTFLSPDNLIHRDEQIPGQSIFDFVLSLKCLRSLTLQNLDTEEIPGSIKQLKHLRYLFLSRFKRLQKLPSEITSLPNLKSLILVFCPLVKELPSDINKLKSLRHLVVLSLSKQLECILRGLGELHCLQTLAPFALGPTSTISTLTLLSSLNNLRVLSITGLESLRDCAPDVEAAKVLLHKGHLQDLQLFWSEPLEAMEDKGVADNDEIILEGLQPHQTIKSLHIEGFCGESFPDWIGNLSSLTTLTIVKSKYVKSLPEGISNLKSLQRLSMLGCPQLSNRCQRERGEDWCKIAHIPHVGIRHCFVA